jgi:hypothetical protein
MPVLLLLGVVAFALGLTELFRLRFESGDVYPPYSSLRADPLGTRAFHDSLSRLPGMTVERDISSANRLPDGRNTVYLHLAGEVDDWRLVSGQLFKEIQSFVMGGGRLVITFAPLAQNPFLGYRELKIKEAGTNAPAGPGVEPERKADETTADNSKKKAPKNGKPVVFPEVDGETRVTRLDEKWGVDFGFVKLEVRDDRTFESAPARCTNDPALPPVIQWHSGLVLTNLAPSWKVVYSRETHPVVAERHFGKGSVVLATDSYFISNEAMRRDRHAALLAWLVGSRRHVVFDEAHLGIAEEPGIAALVRRYRLHGLVLALLALTGLFLWRQTSSLAPVRPGGKSSECIAGRESAAGFTSLLRRHIPPADLLSVCFEEWKRACGHCVSAEKLAQAQAVVDAEKSLPARQRKPVEATRAIARILSARHPARTTPVSTSTTDNPKT